MSQSPCGRNFWDGVIVSGVDRLESGMGERRQEREHGKPEADPVRRLIGPSTAPIPSRLVRRSPRRDEPTAAELARCRWGVSNHSLPLED